MREVAHFFRRFLALSGRPFLAAAAAIALALGAVLTGVASAGPADSATLSAQATPPTQPASQFPAAPGPVRLPETDASSLPPPDPFGAVLQPGWDNLFQNYGNDSGAWSGGDGAQSLLLPNGNTMWFFGDTYLGDVNPDYTRPPLSTGLAHNSAVLQSGSSLALGPTFAAAPGTGGYTFTGNYSWLNPPAPYTDANGYEMINGDQVMLGGGLVYKFMQLADRNEPLNGIPYTLVGTVLQQFGYSTATGQLLPLGAALVPNDGPGPDAVIWGVALLQSDGYLYIYGVRPYDDASLYLARIPLDTFPTQGTAWQYWDAPAATCDPAVAAGSWSSSAAAAQPLMTGVSEGFSVDDVDGTDVLLSDNAASDDPDAAIAHYASCPTGFSTGGPAYTVFNPNLPDGQLAYEYRIVPQFSDGSNVLISYSTDSFRVDNSCLGENYMNASIYRPRFFSVQLPNIAGPTGLVRQATAPAPPPVPPSQYTLHPTGPGDNFAAVNCNPGSAPAAGPGLALTSNVNGVLAIHWAMNPTALWLYTVSYCDTAAMDCPADNSTIIGDPDCATANQDCGNLLVWDSTDADLQFLVPGHRYQITVSTARAVPDPVTVTSNAIAYFFPPPTGCVPDRPSTFPADAAPTDHLDYLAGVEREINSGVGGVSAMIPNYDPWVSPANDADASGEYVELTDASMGADRVYIRVGWQQNVGGARYTHIQWQNGPDNGPYYEDLAPYPVDTVTTYAIVYDVSNLSFIIYADGAPLDYVPVFFTPAGAMVTSDLEDQASQEPGISNDLNRVTGIQAYLDNSWVGLAGETFKRVMTSTGDTEEAAPWQWIEPPPDTPGVVSFSTADISCFVNK